MRWASLLLVLLLTVVVTPSAGAQWANCVPASDATAREIDATGAPAGGGVYYLKQYKIANANYAELWRESNGQAGLQRDETWNCGDAGDTLVQQRCAGKGCPGVPAPG
jgi:hypothetical protein